MIVSIMQPYFLPYIGYFQLIAASDVFVIYDDVQYMKGGWINRNRILLNDAPHWLTLPVERTEVETPINLKRYQLDAAGREKARRLLAAAYAKAPQAAATLPLLDEVLGGEDLNVARFNERGLRAVCRRLGIGTEIVTSSAMARDRTLGGQAAVIDIASRLGARRYLNAAGGTGLYQAAAFAEQGLELGFIRPRPAPYRQFREPHVPNLSIADVLMFCEDAELQALLAAYDIVAPGEADQAAA
jgi:hypothetical protein